MFCLAGDVTIDPPSISIPLDQEPVSRWPDFDFDVRAGHQTFKINYTVTVQKIAVGGAIDFAFALPCHDTTNPNMASNSGYLLGPSCNVAMFPIGAFQTDTPRDPNYTTATVSRPGSLLSLSTVARAADGATSLRVVVGKRPLLSGDRITITFGDRAFGSPGATLSFHPGRLALLTFEDIDGDGVFAAGPGAQTELLCTAVTPTALRINFPVTAIEDQPFDATLEILQGRDEPLHSLLPCENYVGRVRLWELGNPGHSLTVTFDPSMHGVARTPWVLADPGIARVAAVELRPDGSDGDLLGYSNPVDVRDRSAETIVYCGDLHRHSAEGGHAAAPDYLIWQRLWDSRYDFGSVMEHSYTEYFDLQHLNRIARQFQQDVDPTESSFVTFPGYEWTLEGVHRNVVNGGYGCTSSYTDRAYCGVANPPPLLIKSLNGFLAALRNDAAQSRSIAIPHHSLWEQGNHGAYEWGDLLDDPVQPLVEIFSAHGSSERFVVDPPRASDYVMHADPAAQRPTVEEATVQSALMQGRRFGFVGGSDNHGAVNQLMYPRYGGLFMYGRGGLTFVLGEAATASLRTRIWDGLTKRRTYVTTGARMFIDWHATGSGRRRGMGSELTCREVTLHLRVVPSAVASSRIPGVSAYEIWRDGNVLVDHAELAPAMSELDIEFTDVGLPRDGRFHPYYAKAIQDDDHVGWASPIWVKYAK